MSLSPRLRDAPEEFQDACAASRAVLAGFHVTGVLTEEGRETLAEMLRLREEIGWDTSAESLT